MNTLNKKIEKKTIVRNAGDVIITHYNGKFKLIKTHILDPIYHDLYHRFKYAKDFPSSILSYYIREPLSILAIEGSKRVNINLFMAFIGETKTKKMNKMSEAQRVLYDILCFDRDKWDELLSYDVKTFLKLEKHFKIDTFEMLKLDYRKLSILCELGLKKYQTKGELFKEIENFRKYLKLYEHCFCRCSSPRLLNIQKLYKDVIDKVSSDTLDSKIYEFSLFYREMDLLNDYILSIEAPELFNYDLLEENYVTENEKLIRNFVESKVKK